MCDTGEHDDAARPPGLSRRRLIRHVLGGSALLTLSTSPRADTTKALPKPQNVVSGDRALQLLQEGNARYVDGVAKRHDFKHEREPLIAGQNPYAGVLSCADSRVAPEYAFDSARGDLFVCRVAGNFATNEIIASFEYGIVSLALPLILVLGHDACGAISATLKSLKDGSKLPGHLPSLIANLSAATQTGAAQAGDPLSNAIRQNVIDTVAMLKSTKPILSAAVDDRKLKIVGGIYRLASGRVDLVA